MEKEIALIQIHTGLQRDLPDALELAQMALSTDAGRVFVGLPSSTHPASLVAGRTWDTDPNSGKENIEIITEFTPQSIINKLVNKPLMAIIPGSSTYDLTFKSTSRLFLEYVAYSTNTSSTILESGSVQVVCNDPTALISQQNNTNESSGLVQLDFSDPVYNTSTKQLKLKVQNNNTEDYVIEFITRGWDGL